LWRNGIHREKVEWMKMKKLKDIYAVVVEDEENNMEGIPAINADGMAYPLVGGEYLLEIFKSAATQFIKEGKKGVKLLKFTNREEVPLEKHN
jgi:hypothetical protein